MLKLFQSWRKWVPAEPSKCHSAALCQANPASAYAAYSSNLEQEFTSKAEFQQRLAVFTARLGRIEELNAGHPDFFVSRANEICAP